MVTDDVLAYIKLLRDQNVPDTQIRTNLIASGWTDQDSSEALNPSLAKAPLPPAPKPPKAHMQESSGPYTKSMWDAFEHVLLFISLYVLALSITLSLLTFVDKWFPSVDESLSYSRSGIFSSFQKILLRGYVAAIIVSYPVFAFFFYRVTNRTLKFPMLRTLKARKVLIYLTLVITFIIMISYIISTIFSLLNGNFTTNFLLHLLIILGISGAIFAYYLHQVKEDRQYD